MTDTPLEFHKSLVRSFHDGGLRGDLSGVGANLHHDFVCSEPRYLPWGGDAHGAAAYLDVVLPQIARFLDFSRFSYDSLVAEDDRVVALVDVGVMDSDATVKLFEHWTFDAGKARSIRVAYYEPAALLARIERNGGDAS